MALKVGELFASMNLKDDGFSKGLNNAEKQMNKAAGNIKKSSDSMFKSLLKADLFKKAASAVLDSGKAILSVGQSFEAMMSEVGALSGAGIEDMQRMSEAAKEYGATTAFTATQAAEAMKYMALAGWDTEKTLEGLPGVLNLAAASGMDLAAASDAVTDYLSAFGMAASEATKMADMMAYAQAHSNTSATALADAYGNCASQMHAAGQDIETTTAMLMLLADQGLKGSKAGTAVSAVMRDITQKMDKGSIKIGDTAVAVQDAQGNFRDLNDIMADVEAATAGMGSAAKSAALMETFTARSIEAVNKVMTAGTGKFNSYEKALRGAAGTGAEQANKMLDNLQGDLKLFSSAMEGLQLELYDSIQGIAREMVQGGTEIVQSLLEGVKSGFSRVSLNKILKSSFDLMDAIGKQISDGIKAAPKFFARIGELAGPFAKHLLTMAGEAVGSFIKSLPELVPTLINGFANLFTGVVQGLSGFLSSILGVLTGEVTGEEVEKSLKMMMTVEEIDTSSAEETAEEAGKKAATEIADRLKAEFGIVADTLTNGIAKDDAAAVAAMKDAMDSQVGDLASKITAWENAKMDELEASDLRGTALTNAMAEVQQQAEAMRQQLQGAQDDATQWMNAYGEASTKTVKEHVGELDGITQAVADVESQITELTEELETVDTAAPEKSAAEKLVEDFIGAFQGDGSILSNLTVLGGEIVAALDEGLASMGDIGKKAWDALVGAFGTAADITAKLILGDEYEPDESWSKTGGKIWAKIIGGIGTAGELLAQLVLGDEYEADDKWSEVGKKIWAKIKGGLGTAGELIAGLVLGGEYNPDDSWSEVGTKIWKKIVSGIQVTGDWLKEQIGFTPDTSWGRIGAEIWAKIKGGIIVFGDWLKEQIGYTPDTSWSTIGADIWDKIKGGIVATGDWLKEKIGYTPDTSWGRIGADIWEKIKAGIVVSGDWLKEQIGYKPDTTWGRIGADIWGKIKAGIIVGGDWLKEQIGYTPDDSWSAIGGDIWEKIKSGLEEKEKEGGFVGALASAALTATGIAEDLGSAAETLQSNGTLGEIWSSAQSIVQSILGIVQEIVDALWGETEGSDALTSTLEGGEEKANGFVTAVETISTALKGMEKALGFVRDLLGKLNEWDMLDDIIIGIGAAIATNFVASTIANVWSFFQAFSNGAIILSTINPTIMAISAAVGGLVALISWAKDELNIENVNNSPFGQFVNNMAKQYDIGEYDWQSVLSAIEKGVDNYASISEIDWQNGAGFSSIESYFAGVAGALESGTATLDDLEAYKEDMIAQFMDWGLSESDIGYFGLDNLLEQMFASAFGESGESTDAVTQYTQEQVDAAQKAIDEGVAAFQEAGGEAGQGYGVGLAGADVSSSASTFVQNVEDDVRSAQASGSPAQEFMPMGEEAALGYGEGMAQADITSYASTTVRSAMNAVRSAMPISTLMSLGKMFTSGIALGIRQGKSAIIQAATEVAEAAIKAANDKLKIGSPSKVMAETGNYFSQGLALGISKGAGTVTLAAQRLSQSASDALTMTARTDRTSRSIDSSAARSNFDYDRLENMITRMNMVMVANGRAIAQVTSRQNQVQSSLNDKRLALATGRR